MLEARVQVRLRAQSAHAWMRQDGEIGGFAGGETGGFAGGSPGGWAPSDRPASPWECRAAQSGQARPEEAREPRWGAAQAGALPWGALPWGPRDPAGMRSKWQ